MAESPAAVVFVERFDRRPLHVGDRLDDELCDSVAATNLVVVVRIVVDHDHLQLAAVRGVDDARGVDERNPVLERQPAARHDHAHVAARYGDRHAGGHQHAAAVARQESIDARVQVEPCVVGMRLDRERQFGVESSNRHDQR